MSQTAITLDNCDQEPIHIPGTIQSHGSLLAFDAEGILRFFSDNIHALLGFVPRLGMHVDAAEFRVMPAIHEAIRACLGLDRTAHGAPGSMQHAGEMQIADTCFDVVGHASEGLGVVEFEPRRVTTEKLAGFALKSHRAIDKVRRQRCVEELLHLCVNEVRELTGFDRVMAYVFRHDDSGEVVAEAVREDLNPFLGMRYPASDIPTQARRLYVINTLRLIAEVDSQPVPVRGAAGSVLDMSHCVLRSVSPIHIEYLRNLGVAASMSISFVINGKLWGMLACHNMTPRHVPYSVRMACDVLAQMVSATISDLNAKQISSHVAETSSLRLRVVEDLIHAENPLTVLASHAGALCKALGADAGMFGYRNHVETCGDIDPASARRLLQELVGIREEFVVCSEAAKLPVAMGGHTPPYAGLLAFRFDQSGDAWVAFLRKEQVETVRWGGRPQKEYAPGPLGPRLTPRGSFEEWKEDVSGTAVPWSEAELAMAHDMQAAMLRAQAMRSIEVENARTHLLAILGHDLRDPLSSISMAAEVLKLGGQSSVMGQRIQASSNRMKRLISQVLDISRVHGGLGLGLTMAPVDVGRLVDDLIDEAQVAHPDVDIDRNIPLAVMADIDADRFAQVVTNLLGNARHHGTLGTPIRVSLTSNGEHFQLRVANHAPPIPADVVPSLFAPMKHYALHNPRNRSGLGLGLYIASEIARSHGGAIEYRYEKGQVVFVVTLPHHPPRRANDPRT